MSQVDISATVDLSTQALTMFSNLLSSGTFWLPVALVIAMIAMQPVKAILKQVISKRCTICRKGLTLILSYFVGASVGYYFLDGPDAMKWASVIGFVNPVLFYVLTQYAVLNNKLVLLSLLKMRPLKRNPETNEVTIDFDSTVITKDLLNIGKE